MGTPTNVERRATGRAQGQKKKSPMVLMMLAAAHAVRRETDTHPSVVVKRSGWFMEAVANDSGIREGHSASMVPAARPASTAKRRMARNSVVVMDANVGNVRRTRSGCPYG